MSKNKIQAIQLNLMHYYTIQLNLEFHYKKMINFHCIQKLENLNSTSEEKGINKRYP